MSFFSSLPFVQYMDSISIMLTFILLILAFNGIARPTTSMQNALWFGGALAWVVTVLPVSRNIGYANNPHVMTVVVIAFGLMAAGHFIQAFGDMKFSIYTVLFLIIGISFYSIIVIYWNNFPGRVLEDLFFASIMVLSLLGLIGAPIASYLRKKSNIHALWASVGWIFVTIGCYYYWAAAAVQPGAFAGRELEAASFLPAGLGFILVLVSFLLTGWFKEARTGGDQQVAKK